MLLKVFKNMFFSLDIRWPALIFFLAFCPSSFLVASERVALVIGNSNYERLAPLSNPINDAESVAQTLSALDFTVYLLTDLDRTDFWQAFQSFQTKAETAEVSLVYFAGHGVHTKRQSYVLPTDIGRGGTFDMSEAISVDAVVNSVGSDLRTNIVIIDACRDNPMSGIFPDELFLEGDRAVETESAALGTLVTYATTPGQIAFDGLGSHSPFTGALLDHLQTPDLDIELVMRRVRRDVVMNSSGVQVPWTQSTLLSEFKLLPRPTYAEIVLNGPPLSETEKRLRDLSETGFGQKPVLNELQAGVQVRDNSLSLETLRQFGLQGANPMTIERSQQIKAALCKLIAPPLPVQCLNLSGQMLSN